MTVAYQFVLSPHNVQTGCNGHLLRFESRLNKLKKIALNISKLTQISCENSSNASFANLHSQQNFHHKKSVRIIKHVLIANHFDSFMRKDQKQQQLYFFSYGRCIFIPRDVKFIPTQMCF